LPDPLRRRGEVLTKEEKGLERGKTFDILTMTVLSCGCQKLCVETVRDPESLVMIAGFFYEY
jgi:hypothetical protein